MSTRTISKADKVAERGLSMFSQAHAEVTRATEMLAEEERVHNELAREHANHAANARARREAHQATAEKIKQFLP